MPNPNPNRLSGVRAAQSTGEAFAVAFNGSGAPAQPAPELSAGAARFLSLSPQAQAEQVERMALELARLEVEVAALKGGRK
jgi:hypothetical protein